MPDQLDLFAAQEAPTIAPPMLAPSPPAAEHTRVIKTGPLSPDILKSLQRLGLTDEQYRALWYVNRNPGCNCTDVAPCMGVGANEAARSLVGLKVRHFVQASRDPDGLTIYYITREGVAKMEEGE